MMYMDLNQLKKKQLAHWTEIYRIAYDALEHGDMLPGNNYSVEYVGHQFNSTPCVVGEVGIALHSKQIIEDKLVTLEDFEQFFLKYAIEGVVIEHEGCWWKMRSDGFVSCRESPHGWCLLEKTWKRKGMVLKQQWKDNNALEDFNVVPPKLL